VVGSVMESQHPAHEADFLSPDENAILKLFLRSKAKMPVAEIATQLRTTAEDARVSIESLEMRGFVHTETRDLQGHDEYQLCPKGRRYAFYHDASKERVTRKPWPGGKREPLFPRAAEKSGTAT
jgi:predicted ArsR family transcriptional regulator